MGARAAKPRMMATIHIERKYKIKRTEFEIHEEIGAGQFCKVHRATYSGKNVAVKCFGLGGMQKMNREEIINEIKVMATM